MPLTSKQKTGNTVHVYLNTGTTVSRTWLKLGEVSKSTLEISDEMIETTSKADLVKSYTKGIPEVSLPIEYEYHADDDAWDELCDMGDPLRNPDTIREVAILPVAIADIDAASPKTDGPVYAMRFADMKPPADLNGAYKLAGKFVCAKNSDYPMLFSAL